MWLSDIGNPHIRHMEMTILNYYMKFSNNFWNLQVTLINHFRTYKIVDSKPVILFFYTPCSHEPFKSIWNRFQSVWPSCERKQKCPNRFQTDLAQTFSKVGLKSVWNQFPSSFFLFYIYWKRRFQNFLQN